MPNLRISTSGTQSVDTSRVDQAEAFRRQEAIRREQMQQQAIAQQLQAQLARDQMEIQREGLGVQRDLGMGDLSLRREMPGMQADAALRMQGGTGMDLQGAQFAHQQAMAAPQNELAMRRFQQEQTQRGLQMRLELNQLRNAGQISDAEYQSMMAELSGGAGGMPERPDMTPQVPPPQAQTGARDSVHIGGARFYDPDPKSGEQDVVDAAIVQALREQVDPGGDVDAAIAQEPSERVDTPASVTDDLKSRIAQNLQEGNFAAAGAAIQALGAAEQIFDDQPSPLVQANIDRLMTGILQHFGASQNENGEIIWPTNPVKHQEFLDFLAPMEDMTQAEKVEYLQTFSDQRVRRPIRDVTTKDIPQGTEWFGTLNAELNKSVRSRDTRLMRRVIRDLTRAFRAQGVDAVEIGRLLEPFEAAATESELSRQTDREVTKEIQALQGRRR